MRTPEQVRAARQDEELRLIRAENKRLEEKLTSIRKAVKEMFLGLATVMPDQRAEIIAMANELDSE